ncbi:ATP-binding cassette domain-containing protein [Spiroplasma sp. DGKH1]|uniref:ATP-binding cassette domain-containing protein n=1 Tax=Spiroplasma sp. DGKH1 TaxID=3050074 RepID=UPI0034C6AE8A
MNKVISQTKKTNHDNDCAIYVKQFRQFFKSNVIGPFNFKVTTGKMHAIIGASGSGKTVFIKSLIGGYAKHSGIIKILDKDIKDLEVKKRLVMSQNSLLFPKKYQPIIF